MSPRAALNVALERAIYERNCNEVKILIAAGADINHTINEHLDTMLHKAKTAGIARDLLGYSANLHARNLFDRTPLHLAVIDGRSADLVQTLIEHGPNVNVKDSEGLTPLHYAVKSKNVDLIKCLVMNNASISFKEVLTDLSPLCSAMLQEDMTGVKALIKYGLLKDFEDNYSRVIDLHAYYRMKNFFMVRVYLNQCGTEILKMKEEKMSDEVTLFQIIKSRCVPLESLYKDSKGMESFTKRAFEVITGNSYPHYNDVITERLRNKLQVSSLRSMLSIVQVSTVDTDSDKSEHMTLNSDINAVLAKYLPKNDLFNLILASFEPCNYEIDSRNLNDINFIKRSIMNLTAPSAATSSPKRMKLI